MAKRTTHKDVEYEVGDRRHGTRKHFKKFDEAAAYAVVIAASGVSRVHLDTLCWSEAGARFLGGDDGVEQYREDPDASVFDRIEIDVNNVGRVR
jgi:hypothetical protein